MAVTPAPPARGAGLVDPRLALASILLTALAQPHLFASETLVGLDTATQYYPWYAYLGQSMRAGHIPGWNPATLSGTPFAANPLSGCTYLPAMLVFGILPVASAVRVYLLLQPLLAACGAFTLARVLGLSRAGALLAGVAYANTSFVQVQNASSSPFASVYAKAIREPTLTGGGVFQSTDSMFTYHFGALVGSAANAATSSQGRLISVSVSTFTAMAG